MTNQHPLTDEVIEEIAHSGYIDDYGRYNYAANDLRAAADWQLEQVIKFMKERERMFGGDGMISILEDAMRPLTQENKLMEVNSDEIKPDANHRCRDLRNAIFWGVSLRGANLAGANLSGADLRGSNLESAKLAGANLRGADLEKANLKGCDLRGADLQDANLRGANLEDATVSGTILDKKDDKDLKFNQLEDNND